MTDNSGAPAAPGGSPGNAPAPSNNAAPQRPSMPAQSPAQPESNPRARGHSPAADARQQQQAPAEQKIRVGDSEFTQQELSDVIARDAESRIRRSELPATAEAYEAKNSPEFKMPQGVGAFEFNPADPALLAVKKFALDNGLTQSQFSGLLDIYAASQINGQMQQMRAREVNLAQLGAAGPQRIGAVATWLKAIAGKDGAQVADFISKWPSAPIVRSLETVIKRFSSQGGADYSQQHRETQAADQTKIPGYDSMTFTQRRAHQMVQQFGRGQNDQGR